MWIWSGRSANQVVDIRLSQLVKLVRLLYELTGFLLRNGSFQIVVAKLPQVKCITYPRGCFEREATCFDEEFAKFLLATFVRFRYNVLCKQQG